MWISTALAALKMNCMSRIQKFEGRSKEYFSLPCTLSIPAGVAPGAARRLIRRHPAERKACHVALQSMRQVYVVYIEKDTGAVQAGFLNN